jgi:hypothetical protein
MKFFSSLFLLAFLTILFVPFGVLHAQNPPTTPPGGLGTTGSTDILNNAPAPKEGGAGFVPLTSIPGIETVAGSDGIASFLNNLYKIAIGAAAVLAVLQITRAGLMYMTEESISEKKEARHLIVMSIMGLVLVLSPAIVFGIIDPRILNLDVDISGLKPPARSSTDGTGNATVPADPGTGTDGTGTDTSTDTDDTTDAVTCDPGEVEEFSSDGSVECVTDDSADAGTPNSEQIVVRLQSTRGESVGTVFVGYVFGTPSAYSCPPIGEGACGYTTAAGPACSYVSFVYHAGNNIESQSSCASDPGKQSSGGQVFLNCVAKSVPQNLTFQVQTPRCAGQPQFNP